MVEFAPLFGFDYTLERRVVRFGHGFERIFLELSVHPRLSVYKAVQKYDYCQFPQEKVSLIVQHLYCWIVALLGIMLRRRKSQQQMLPIAVFCY